MTSSQLSRMAPRAVRRMPDALDNLSRSQAARLIDIVAARVVPPTDTSGSVTPLRGARGTVPGCSPAIRRAFPPWLVAFVAGCACIELPSGDSSVSQRVINAYLAASRYCARRDSSFATSGLARAPRQSVKLRRRRTRLRSDCRVSVIRRRERLPAADLDVELWRRCSGRRSEVARPAFPQRPRDIDIAVTHEPQEVGALESEQACGVRAVAAGCGERPFDDFDLNGCEE